MSGGSPVIVFSVLLVFSVVAVVGIFVVIVGIIGFSVVSVVAVVGLIVVGVVLVNNRFKKSSSLSSATLAVDCGISCCSWGVKAMVAGS